MGEDFVLSDAFGGTVDGVGVIDVDGSVNGVRFVRLRDGRRLTRRRRRLEMIKRGLLEEAFEDADGAMVYWHPSGKKNYVILANGDSVSTSMVRSRDNVEGAWAETRRDRAIVPGLVEETASERYEKMRRNELEVAEKTFEKRISEYKEGLSEVLGVVGYVQRKVLMQAADDEVVLSADDVRKLRLGLDACDRVLDRLIGKPKTVSEVKHSDVFAEISKLDDEWVIESDSVIVEVDED